MEGWKELDLSLVITKAVRNVYTDIPVLHLQSGCECLSSRHHVESLCTLPGSMTNKKSPCLKKKIKYVFLGPMSQTTNTEFFGLRKKVFLGRCQMKMLQWHRYIKQLFLVSGTRLAQFKRYCSVVKCVLDGLLDTHI